MKKCLVLVLTIAAVWAAPKNKPEIHAKWTEFKLAHNKAYSNPLEDFRRKAIFHQNLNEIETHNSKYEKGEVIYFKSLNHFGDMTKEEFSAYVSKGKNKNPKVPKTLSREYVKSGTPLAVEVDWRGQATSEVKNQGQCGSCWSFSTTGAIEGQLALTRGGLISLSEQNLIDCSGNYGNEACDGGWMENAFQYVHDQGIMAETSYPYEGRLDSCRFEPSMSVISVEGIYEISVGDEDALADATANYGPIAVAIDATDELQFYGGGVFYDATCSDTNLNHGVLVVGYGNEDGYDYWILKNSWGEDWGESGYWKQVRNYGNNCGIATAPTFPSITS